MRCRRPPRTALDIISDQAANQTSVKALEVHWHAITSTRRNQSMLVFSLDCPGVAPSTSPTTPGAKHASSQHSLQGECWFLDNSPTVKHVDRMNITFPWHEAVSREINAKYLFLRQVSDFGPFSAAKCVSSRHSLQIECWFLDKRTPVDYADRMNTSFPGHKAVSHEILTKHFIFDDMSDLPISDAQRVGFCERMCLSLQVGVYRLNTALIWDHKRLVIQENAGRCVVWCHRKGHDGRLGGQIVACGCVGGGTRKGFDPEFGVWADSGPGEAPVFLKRGGANKNPIRPPPTQP